MYQVDRPSGDSLHQFNQAQITYQYHESARLLKTQIALYVCAKYSDITRFTTKITPFRRVGSPRQLIGVVHVILNAQFLHLVSTIFSSRMAT